MAYFIVRRAAFLVIVFASTISSSQSVSAAFVVIPQATITTRQTIGKRHQQQQHSTLSSSCRTTSQQCAISPPYHGGAQQQPPFLLFMSSNSNHDDSMVNNNDTYSDQQHHNTKETINNKNNNSSNKLDLWLSRLTTAFPVFVAAAAATAFNQPELLLWVNRGQNTVTMMLAAVMCGTGLTLEADDFTNVVTQTSQRMAVPLGVACQFGIMPLAAWAVGKVLLLQRPIITAAAAATLEASSAAALQAALYLGLILVGCSPGGTASNLVALIAGADVALSVILTACSTLAAVVATPLLVKVLVGNSVTVSGWALCGATAKVVLAPVVGGMLLKRRAPRLARGVGRFTPFLSVLLVSLICGGVVAETAPLLSAGTGASGMTGSAPAMVGIPLVLSAVLLLHSIGFVAGYCIPKLLSTPEKSARTISIEVGMQNSALAVVLARSIPGVHPAASLPGALSATAHSCLGSFLAAFWRLQASRKNKWEQSTSGSTVSSKSH